MEVMENRPSPANTSLGSLALVPATQVFTVAASPFTASATRMIFSEYVLESAAAFWLTIAATPEGAQGHVTVHVVVLLPQPASAAAAIVIAKPIANTLFFINTRSFLLKCKYCVQWLSCKLTVPQRFTVFNNLYNFL